MLITIIRNLKDIDAEHLLENKCKSYVEGVRSAWDAYNAIIMLVPWNEIEDKVKMKLALAYADRDYTNDNEEQEFQTGMIDFYEYVLDYE